MLKIDNNLLQELGLASLPDSEKNSLLKHIYETLEMRVGMRLADQMTNQQLDEFEQYFEAKDDAGAFKWLESNFPNYKDIVQEEFNKLKGEVGQAAPQILAASQAAAAPAPIPVPNPTEAAPAAQNSFASGQAFQDAQPGYQPQQAPAPAQPYAAPPAPAASQSPFPQPGTQPQGYQPPFPDQQPPAGPAAS